MIEDDFDPSHIKSTNLNVCLKPDRTFGFIGTDGGVQDALKRQLEETILAFAAADGDWQSFDIAEDYGADRKVVEERSGEMWGELSRAFEAHSLPPLAKPLKQAPTFDWYFAEFFDDQNRKIVGIKRATQFKVDIGARHRLVRWMDDSLTMVSGVVMRLDKTFDALVSKEHVFILKPRQIEHVAGLESYIAAKAASRLEKVAQMIEFLDLTRLAADISKHPRMARLAIAIASRSDLGEVDQALLMQSATTQGIKFKKLPDERLQVLRKDELKLLEVLDNRRYTTRITKGVPLLWRATARQRVTKSE